METLQETSPKSFKLYIPETFNADILSLVKQLDLNIKQIERKRDKVKRYANRTLNDFGFTERPEQNIVDAWNHCLSQTESVSAKTLSEFWDALLSQITLTFKPNSNNNLNVLATLDKLQKVVYTALTQSLFMQFADEKDLLKCTEQLYTAISNPPLVNWDLVNADAFKLRFEGQQWTVFRPLMVDAFDGRLNTALLTSIGLKEQDVISALCVDSKFMEALLIDFEKPQDIILQELIGVLLYSGIEYFVAAPVLDTDSQKCLIVSKRYPHPSVFFFTDKESMKKIKDGVFFKDDENLVLKLLDVQKKEVVPSTFKLFVSERFKPKLFALFNDLYLDKFGNESQQERKRDILKQIFSRSASDFFGIEAKKADVSTEWERCLKVAEFKNNATLFEFFDTLSQEINQTFQMRLAGGWGAPEKHRILSFTLYTALVQSLFEQFVNEKNLYKCTLKLNQAIKNHSVIFWDEIDKKDFNTRLKEQWHAFRPLMYDSCLNRTFSSLGLLNGLGLELSDFTQVFFSEHPYQKAESKYPLEIFQHIAFRIDTYKLNTFRSVNKIFYNAIEQNDILRKKHRLYLLSGDYLLQELIGKLVFYGNDYLLTDPTTKHRSYNYCVTSMQKPYPIVSYGGNQGQYDKLMGGYVFVDSDKKINILTAFGKINFAVQLLKMDALVPYIERPVFERVSVKVTNYSSSFFHRRMTISLNEKEVQVDIECQNGNNKLNVNGCFFFKVENYHAKFNMDDFSNKPSIQVQAALKS